MTLTYKEITDRVKSTARELTPALPEKGDLESWESFRDDCETARDNSSDLAHGEVDSWDWCIYTHHGVDILNALPSYVESDAEDSYMECNGDMTASDIGGWREMASGVAYWALVNLLREAIDSTCEELIELAETQIENLES